MTKSPVVYTAGLLRIRGDRITTEDWIWLNAIGRPAALLSAERLGLERRPLARHLEVPRPLADRERALKKHAFNAEHASPATAAERPASSSTGAPLGGPRVTDHTRALALAYAEKTMAAAIADDDRQRTFPLMTYNALRHLVAVSPEMQTA